MVKVIFIPTNVICERPEHNDKGILIYESKKSAAYPEAIGDKLYIFTNDNAPNYRLMVAEKNNPEYTNWKALIPESETVMQSYVVTKNNIIIQDKKDIQSRLTFMILMEIK